MCERNRTTLNIAGVITLSMLGFYALHHLLLEVRLHDVWIAMHALHQWQIISTLGLTAASYLLLTLYDVMALRLINKPLPWRTAALASFTSYTLSHNLGFSIITGGSARYRIYRATGLSPADIAKVIAATGVAFWAGIVVMAATALVIHPTAISFGSFSVPLVMQRLSGLGILTGAGWLLFAMRKPRQPLAIFGWTMPLPSTRQGLAQIGLAGLDLAVAGAALFVLVPNVDAAMFPAFFLAYALAIIAAMVTHVPGGIGVFEAVMIAALPTVDKSALMAALVGYRVIYYLLPLLIAAVLLVIHEKRQWHDPFSAAFRQSQSLVAAIAPMLLSALTFTGGIILLVSGSLPAIHDRLQILRHVVPLPFVEASHIAASLAGTGLLLMAPGLYRRLDGAFILTRLLLLAGAIFSLVKGVDYEEAIVLIVIATLLQSSRASFYRRTALTLRSFSAGWIAAMAVAVGLALYIGIFAFKHVDYQGDLWWQFAWRGDASRFLRGSFATAVVLVAAVVLRFFAPSIRPDRHPDICPPEKCGAIADADHSDTMLAWTGDKRFLWSDDHGAFLMHQIQGHSWIVMGDPVGPKAAWPDLLWRIREQADAAQGRLLLYQVTADALPIAIDLGLQLAKYGEEARVDLACFTLDGPGAKSLRHAERRAVRDAAEFAIVPAAQVHRILPQLEHVSDAWLKLKGHTEKLFSVGRFDPAYLVRFDCAVVRRHGEIVAFANIWSTANRNELSIDLMRHVRELPYGTMDLLFVELMRWGQKNGFRWFSLGIAPLSGIEARRLAPFWTRAGALLYRHGDNFYGFEGLRAYKEKFSPLWTPRYIAGPHGVGLARALIDLQTLVGGGHGSAARPIKLERSVCVTR